MSARRGAVFLSEDVEDHAPGDGVVLAGTLSGHHELGGDIAGSIQGAAPAAAIAWARERADRVWVRLDDVRYSAGVLHDEDASRWPPPHPVRRRRRPGEEWRDRSPGDPPIAWFVHLELSPPFESPRPDWEAMAAALAARAGAARWSSTTLDLPEGVAAAAEANPDEEVGWFASVPTVASAPDPLRMAVLTASEPDPDFDGYDLTTYRLELELSTAGEAMRLAVARCGAPDRWGAVAWAYPLAEHEAGERRRG